MTTSDTARFSEFRHLLTKQGLASAARYLEQWSGRHGETSTYFVALAFFHRKAGRLAEAEESLTRAVALDDDELSWLERATLRMRLGRWDEAMSDLDGAQRVLDRNGDGIMQGVVDIGRMEVLYGQRKYKQAVNLLTKMNLVGKKFYSPFGVRDFDTFLDECRRKAASDGAG